MISYNNADEKPQNAQDGQQHNELLARAENAAQGVAAAAEDGAAEETERPEAKTPAYCTGGRGRVRMRCICVCVWMKRFTTTRSCGARGAVCPTKVSSRPSRT